MERNIKTGETGKERERDMGNAARDREGRKTEKRETENLRKMKEGTRE